MTGKNGMNDLAALLQCSELTIEAYTSTKTKKSILSEQTYVRCTLLRTSRLPGHIAAQTLTVG